MTISANQYLPAKWKTSTIGEVASVKGGKRLPKGEKLSSRTTTHPYLRVTDFSRFSIDVSNIQYITDDIFQKISRYTIDSDDVFISIAGSLGIVGRIPDELTGANLTENAAKLTINSMAELVPQFLMYWLASDFAQREIAAQRVKNAQPKLALARIKLLKLPIPPLPEQRRIAAVLSLVQRAIEKQERLIALTTELKKALMHKLFTEGTRGEPQKQTEIGPIPESWEVVNLGKIGKLLSGGTPSKKRQDFWNGKIPWISPKDMKRSRLQDSIDHITDTGLEEGSTLAPSGSLFIVIRGMILAKDVPVALTLRPMAFNQDMKAIIPSEEVCADYLLYAMQNLKPYLQMRVGSSAHGTRTLLTRTIEECQIPLPGRRTQERIAQALLTLEGKINFHKKRRTSLQDLFRTLLHQLMTAEIRVNDLDLEEFEIKLQE